MVTEFVAVDEGGNGDHVVLGRPLAMPPGDPGDTAAADRVVDVSVSQAPTTGPDGELRLVVRDQSGGPVDIGTYLGARLGWKPGRRFDTIFTPLSMIATPIPLPSYP